MTKLFNPRLFPPESVYENYYTYAVFFKIPVSAEQTFLIVILQIIITCDRQECLSLTITVLFMLA